MQKYNVMIIEEAEKDLLDIYEYIAYHDTIMAAEKLINTLESACLKLDRFPERGRIPPELKRIAVTGYRESIAKPYRLIYDIIDENVFIHCILS